jgi:GMP synthase (glutamine-hydrolysing)
VGGFAALVRAGLSEVWDGDFIEVDARVATSLPAPESLAGMIVTGSASSVTERAAWMLRAEQYLAEAARAAHAVLGICFGHQLLGQALGGLVEANPSGREMGTIALSVVADDPLLDRSIAPALAHATHVDAVTRLPPGAQVLATTALDRHSGLRFGERAWGVQFHPEFDERVMAEYVQTRSAILTQEGRDPQAMLEAIKEARAGRSVLRRFVEHGVHRR